MINCEFYEVKFPLRFYLIAVLVMKSLILKVWRYDCPCDGICEMLRRLCLQRIEPYPGTVMMYPSELSIPRPQVTPVGYSSSFYY